MAPRFCLLALVFLVMAWSGTLFTGPPQLVGASILGEIGDAKEVFEEVRENPKTSLILLNNSFFHLLR